MDKSKMIEKLVEYYTHGNKAKFAHLLGISPQTVSTWISRGTFDAELLFAKCESVNPSWLLSGEGDIILDDASSKVHRFESKSSEIIDPNGEIILYDLEAAANLKTLLTNKDQNILGKISIPNIPRCDGAVYVKGDSMYPLLMSGDIVAYKEIPVDVQHIFFGEMYLVSIDLDGDEYLTVKYVQHSERGDEWIKLASHNPHHEPKDFPLAAVRALALVKLSIRMNTMK